MAVAEASFNNSEMAVFPNPTSGLVSIRYTGADRLTELSVINGVGQLVYHLDEVRGNLKSLDLGELSPGLYIVHARTDKGIITQKLQIVK
jgi:hypothetical protein